MSTARALLLTAALAAPSSALAATDRAGIESAQWMTDAITWLAETFGPNIPTEVQPSSVASFQGGEFNGQRIARADLADWSAALEELADDYAVSALELEDGGYTMDDDMPMFLLSGADLYSASLAQVDMEAPPILFITGVSSLPQGAVVAVPVCVETDCPLPADYVAGDALVMVPGSSAMGFYRVWVD